MLNPMLEAAELMLLNKKMDAAISAEDVTMVHLRPIRGALYASDPRSTPKTPGM